MLLQHGMLRAHQYRMGWAVEILTVTLRSGELGVQVADWVVSNGVHLSKGSR